MAEKRARLRESKCRRKAVWPLNIEKLERKHKDPSVNNSANFCGAKTIIGKNAKAKVMSNEPRSAALKKDIHRCLDMAFSEMVVLALLTRPFARPVIAATLSIPFWVAEVKPTKLPRSAAA